jgi:uncharacterized membrane protein
MTYGPIDFIALEFQGNQFKGHVLASLLELIKRKIVRVIDLVIIVKDLDGEVKVRELQQLSPDLIAAFDPLEAEVTQMVTDQDLENVSRTMENNSTAAVMLFENLWAIKFKEAVLEANGRVIFQERIPHEVVEEAVAEMAALREAAE